MKKIVHIILSLELGGAERMLERLIKESSKDNSIQQSIITLKNEGSIGRQLKIDGFDVTSMGMKYKISSPFILFRLKKILRKKKPDAVYTWMYHSDLIGGIAAYLAGIKNIIWGIRNSKIPQSFLSSTSFVRKICALLSSYIPTRIICCAEAAKLTHIELGYCLEKMTVITNGYDLKSFNPSDKLRSSVRKNLGFLENDLVIGTIGRFDPLKDFNNFIQAATSVLKDHKNVKFLMIGKGLDKNNAKLNSWIHKTQYPDNFILLGEKNPHDFFTAMDLYCLSSKSEGFPNVVAEAMAMQIPCVVTDVGDAGRIVEDSGIIVDPEDSNSLHKGLALMLSKSKKDREILGHKARNLIENKYDIKVIKQKFIDLIN